MLIYQPKGKAREYSPLALNIFNGCDHGCSYCYIPDVSYRPDANLVPHKRKNILHQLEKELKTNVPSSQVLLCFLCDPYPIHDIETAVTRSIIEIFLKYQIKTAILSKGGERCMRDIDLFLKFPFGKLKFGTTLTFFDDSLRKKYEPNASPTMERLFVLDKIKSAGIKTFVSIEPVIDPFESLKIISASIPFVDQYKIGKLNHIKTPKPIDWNHFLKSALSITRQYNKEIYIKNDLRECTPHISLNDNEKNMDFLNL